MMYPRFAVIPSKPRSMGRLRLLDRCIEAIQPQVDQIFLIDNTEDGSLGDAPVPENLTVQWEPLAPVNLSYLWNVGLTLAWQKAQELSAESWDVAILNDDAIVPGGWFDVVSGAMRAHGAAAGCSRNHHGGVLVHREAKPVNLFYRMSGWAFILAGEKGARANEQLKWWFGDDHLDWLSRKLGGVAVVPGYEPEHLAENGQVTPELQEQIAKDAAAFVAYWGMRPW